MFFISIIITIFIISLGFSLISLRKELQKIHEKKAGEVKKELGRGRVIFYSPSSPSSKD